MRRPPARPGYVVCSAYPRLVDGKPSKNPRYLQIRPDLPAPWKNTSRRAACGWHGGSQPRAAAAACGCGADRAAQQPARSPRRASGLWPCTARSITRSSPNCSWTSSARSPARVHRPPAPAGRGADQGPIQRPAHDHRSQRGARLLHPHRPGGLLHGRWICRPADARRSRHQPARAGGLVPAPPQRARPVLSDRRGPPRATERFRARRSQGSGQSVRLPR